MSEEVIHQSPLLYRLLRIDGGLTLEVVVGGIAMSTVRVALSPREAEGFAREGISFVDRMALQIMSEPTFGGRAVVVGAA